MFYGCDFTFNGKKASSFGLMLYNVGSYGQDDVDFSVGEIVEDRISRRYDSLLYGLVQNEPLQFTLVFGTDPDNLVGEACLSRAQIAEITKWLTGHQTYKILKIDQDDMKDYFYRVMVTGLKLIADGGLPTAFSAEITCDSPFAYKYYYQWFFDLQDGDRIKFDNLSMAGQYYYPVLDLDLNGATSISLANTSDGGRSMSINGIPTDCESVHIDCQNQLIRCNTGFNLYPKFNKKFLRLIPGENSITISTDGTVGIQLTCNFPVNIGA